jgi:hypothetical protein
MEVLVIDEVSMVRADVLDAIDAILKSARRKYDEALVVFRFYLLATSINYRPS